MKLMLKTQAVALRKQGKTYSEIRAEIEPVSKGTLSRWLKDTVLTSEQAMQIKNKIVTQGHKGRLRGALQNKQKRVERLTGISKQAKKEYPKLVKNPRFTAGLVLYLAEGNKKQERFEFMNSDPYLVEIITRWVKEFGNTKESDNIKYRLYIHDVYAHENCEQFWGDFLKLNPDQFLKTIHKATPHLVKRNPEYKGCIRMEITGSELYWKVMTWQQCLYKSLRI